MDRKEFLKSIGAGAAFALTFGCLGGCLKEDPNPNDIGLQPDPVTGALFSIDLTTSEANALASNGGYIIKNSTVVAKNSDGQYVAATVVCSHEYKKKVVFRNNEYYCTEHGARFDQNGKGLNADGRKGLTVYTTAVEGNILTVYA